MTKRLLRQLNWLPVKQLLYNKDSVLTYKCFKDLAPKQLMNLLNASASMLATPASLIYYTYHCIELLLANAHSHIEKLVFGTI